MSISRQSPQPAAARVRSYSITHPPGVVALPTQPGWDQLVFAHSGYFTARTRSQAWTIPAHRALCVPDGTRVTIETTRRAGIRCLYTDSRLQVLGSDLRVVGLGALARELVVHTIDSSPMDLSDRSDAAVITLLTEQLAIEPDAPLRLPLPVDAAARAVAAAVMRSPAADLDRLLVDVGAGRRTVERRFRSETAMSLGQWRRRARVLAGVAMLAEGDSVTRVASAIGYSTPSAFVAAFRSELHAPPLEFMRNRTLRSSRS
jgi:AraC-like DNA-binding protein